MLKKFAAAAIVASLIAGPAFAQGVLQPAAPKAPATTAQQAVKADTKVDAKVDAKIAPKAAVTTGVQVKETGAVTTPARKHVTVVKHNRKHVRHYGHAKKHIVHVKKVKHVKHVKVKSTRDVVKM
jgi:hypothetical protein